MVNDSYFYVIPSTTTAPAWNVYSFDNEETYSEEITMDDWLNSDVTELWERLPENKKLLMKFVLHDNATISRFKITYEN